MHILLKKIDNYKGILIITHKEIQFLKFLLPKLKKNYYILCHYGFNVPIDNNKYIDKNLLVESRKNNNKISFTSRNFLSNEYGIKKNINDLNNLFKKYNINICLNEKIDFLNVGRCVEMKKTIDILINFNYFNKMNDYKYTMCFVILKQPDKKYYNIFIEIYNNISNNKNIILVDTYKDNDYKNDIFFGLIPKELSIIYTNSKIYIHSCEVAEYKGGS